MLKKTITFEDLDGNSITEDFYFHLYESEVIEMEIGKKGGLTEYLKKIVAEEDGDKLVGIFKDLLTKTVGKRSDDGRKFIKNQAIIDDFVQTDAYSKLFVELATNAEQAAAFANAIVPASMHEKVKQSQLKNIEDPDDVKAMPASVLSFEEEIEEKFKDPSWVPSSKDIQNMTAAQIQRAFRNKQVDTAPIVRDEPLA